MINILVTGGAGYIGSHTVRALLKANYNVVVLDNLSTGFEVALPIGTVFKKGDVRNEFFLNQIMREQKFDAVIHLAAKLNVQESTTKPLEYFENNTYGMLTLLKSMEKHEIKRIVFSSTAAVFGNLVQNRPLIEDDEKKPLNPYGESKLASEKILESVSQLGNVKFCTLRYFNVAGGALDGLNGQRTAKAYHLIHLSTQKAARKLPFLEIFGTDYSTEDGTCVRDYIHVEDIADIHVLALQSLLQGAPSASYNCGYGTGYTVREVISVVQKISGYQFKVRESLRRAGDPAFLVADSSKLKNVLGWKPLRQDLEIICKTAYQWEMKNK